jgi:uncharacterized protein (TIGR03083 family)
MTDQYWVATQRAFVESAEWFLRTVAECDGHWQDMALGEWTVRDLVGHTSRALLTVESYLDKPAESAEVASAAEYFALSLGTVRPADVAQRGRETAATLGSDPLAAVQERVERVVARVGATPPDALLTTPVGGMRLIDYLPSRTFELTVHTCDLATAIGAPVTVPAPAASTSLALIAGLAIRGGQAGPLLLAATGRGGLPSGYTVLG